MAGRRATQPLARSSNLPVALGLALFAVAGGALPAVLYANPGWRTVDAEGALPANVARRGAFLNSGSKDAGPSVGVVREIPKT